MQYGAVCCSVLQCVAVLVDLAGSCIVLYCVAVCCSVLQCVAVLVSFADYKRGICCSILQGVVVCCSMLQCVAVLVDLAGSEGVIMPMYANQPLQHTATHCNTLQHTEMYAYLHTHTHSTITLPHMCARIETTTHTYAHTHAYTHT